MDKRADTFLEYKALLFSIAYNMLGSVSSSEDIVQDVFVKWMEQDLQKIDNTKAFLVRMVTNQCINQLGSSRARKEEYVGVWLPEPVQDSDPGKVHAKFESYHALSIGMLVLMEKLTPQERAIFLLKEIFAYDYFELAEIFGKTADNCRQILKRAKDNLGKDTKRFTVDMQVHERMLNNFLEAIAAGNVEGLIGLLKEDILLLADGGGKAFEINGKRITAFSRPISGREHVSRLLLKLVPQFRTSVPDFNQRHVFVNGMPSILSFSGEVPVSLVSLESDGEQIRNIYVQTNPEKLKHFSRPEQT